MGTTTESLISQASNYPDIVFIALLFGAFVLYGLLRGVKALSEFALAIPIAAFIYTLFPYELDWKEPALFGAIVLVSAWVLARDTSGLDDSKSFIKIALAAAGAAALLVVISAGTIDFTSLYVFGPQVTAILAIAKYKFYIAAAGLITIALSRKV